MMMDVVARAGERVEVAAAQDAGGAAQQRYSPPMPLA